MSKLYFTSSLLCLTAAAALLPVGCASSSGTPDSIDSVSSALASDGGAAGSLLVSQVFGGPGAFIEIFNPTKSAVTMTGLSVQVATGSGDFGADPSSIIPLSGSLKAGGFFLLGRTGVANADQTAAFSLDSTDGKVVIATGTNALNCGGGANCTFDAYLDLVGYGAVTQFEGTKIVGLDGGKSAQRKNNGCTDTNNNARDFDTLAPSPRNSTSAVNLCTTGTKDAGGDAIAPIGVTDPDLPDDPGFDSGVKADAGKSSAAANNDDSGCSSVALGAGNASAMGLVFAAGFAVAARRRRRRA